ncbi:MAG: LPS export ABC transporter periplasmic protein LptC [Azospirillum sp.]|nr:LPS export ABC transporter periplasmic protein LptC [Azospirillum sp.]MCA3266288.1 LPS export ABC transporter periplasmic protein LptC [Azospirillum sp.]MCZ8123423.1 LPS export ABC transporter periplasmic protein LptC [Magnetospirillum sp.]
MADPAREPTEDVKRPVPVPREPGAEPAEPPRPRLAGFAPGERRSHSTLYSQIVGLLKFVLPAVALGLATLVLIWPQLNPLDQRFRLVPVQVTIEDLENLRMVQPRYVGVDEQSQPFTIVADQASQPKGSSESTDLLGPQGDIQLNQGAWLAMSAERGVYHQTGKLLDLAGAVQLFHDGGYEISTETAQVDLDKGFASGDTAVRGQGPNSLLEGEGFRIHDRGQRVEVVGPARVVLYPTPRATPGRAPQNAAVPPAPPAPVPAPPRPAQGSAR